MKIFSLLAICTLATFSAGVHAQRAFPPDAPRGYLSPPTAQNPSVRLNDKPIPLTPGAQIRDESNIIVPPGMVRRDSIVKYKLDGGALHRAWVLTPGEIAAPDVYKLPSLTPTGDGSDFNNDKNDIPKDPVKEDDKADDKDDEDTTK